MQNTKECGKCARACDDGEKEEEDQKVMAITKVT